MSERAVRSGNGTSTASSLGRQLSLIWTLTAKDLKIEYRSRRALQTTLFFALLVLIVFQFGFDPGSEATQEASAAILWIALLFPGMIRLNQSFQTETEDATIHGIILSPVDRGVLFLSKFLSNWLFLTTVGLFTVAVFMLFFNLETNEKILWLLLIVLLGLAGFSAVGTVLAAMVASSSRREVLLPILIFPIFLPVILAAVASTQTLLTRPEIETFSDGLKILTAFDVIYLATGYLVFGHVVGE